MEKEDYKEVTEMLSNKELLSEEELDKVYEDIKTIKEMDVEGENKYITMAKIINELEKERLIKEKDIMDFLNKLSKDELDEFNDAVLDELDEYEIEDDDDIEIISFGFRIHLSMIMATVWLIFIASSVNNLFTAMALSVFPAYFMKRANEMISIY